MKYDKYIIKKDKTDLLSSLKALNKDIINESLEDYDLDNIEDLKEYIIDSSAFCLSASKTDLFTRLYFQKLLDNENSMNMSAYQDDIEALWVFVYEKDNYLSYYIPTEIKKIIKKELNIK